eukprot:ctg_3098.g546
MPWCPGFASAAASPQALSRSDAEALMAWQSVLPSLMLPPSGSAGTDADKSPARRLSATATADTADRVRQLLQRYGVPEELRRRLWPAFLEIHDQRAACPPNYYRRLLAVAVSAVDSRRQRFSPRGGGVAGGAAAGVRDARGHRQGRHPHAVQSPAVLARRGCAGPGCAAQRAARLRLCGPRDRVLPGHVVDRRRAVYLFRRQRGALLLHVSAVYAGSSTVSAHVPARFSVPAPPGGRVRGVAAAQAAASGAASGGRGRAPDDVRRQVVSDRVAVQLSVPGGESRLGRYVARRAHQAAAPGDAGGDGAGGACRSFIAQRAL